MHEYLFGIYYKYHNNREELNAKLAAAKRDLTAFEILPVTSEIVEISSRIHAELAIDGVQIGINDIYIAATALRYGLRLVTRDKSHFQRVDKLRIEGY